MTYEEAIDILSAYKMTCEGCRYNHELGCELNKNCCEAVDIAISALQEKLERGCSND